MTGPLPSRAAVTSPQVAAAYAVLADRDLVLSDLIQRVGQPDPTAWAGADQTGDDLFAGLTLHIIGQQISIAAALTIFGRLSVATGKPPTAGETARLSPEQLRQLGLSGAKARAIGGLATAVACGEIDLDELRRVDDDAATQALVQLPGVGPWTAQMFLMHQLRRADVLPVGDVGLKEAVRRAWSLSERPDETSLVGMANRWRPYRSYATALLWKSLKAGPAADRPPIRNGR